MSQGKIVFSLHLHPEAAKNFDEKAQALVSQIVPAPKHEPKQGFRPQPHVTHTLSSADIAGELKLGLVDYAGRRIAKFFEDGDKFVGLSGSAFQDFRRITEGLQASKELRSRVSSDTLADLSFDWVKARHKGTTQEPMCAYVLSRAAARIQTHEIWIPIARLHIETEFTIGRVTFRPLTAGVFDNWQAGLLQRNNDRTDQVRDWINRERTTAQGLAAATMVVDADEKRALEIAFAESEDAVAMLRLFDQANFDPNLVSLCALLGRENEERKKYILVRDGVLAITGSGLAHPSSLEWVIDKSRLEFLWKSGLARLDMLLGADRRAPFQEQILDALRIFSRSSVARDPADKLIYMLVALESVFVRNETEPLTENIAHRIAFFLYPEFEKRRETIDVVKKAYGLRSAFLHHGKRLEDLEALRRFMDIAFRCMIGFLQNADRFSTMDEFHKAIEKERLS